MFKGFLKEIALAAILTLVLFLASDSLGGLLVPETGEVTLSAGLLAFSMLVLVLPPLIGSIPSGYLIGKKTKDIKAILFAPALGAAIGGLLLMSISVVSILIMPDAALQEQMAQIAEYGGRFFEGMSLQEYKSFLTFSMVFGALFLALINFAIGLAGGFVGSKLAKNK